MKHEEATFEDFEKWLADGNIGDSGPLPDDTPVYTIGSMPAGVRAELKAALEHAMYERGELEEESRPHSHLDALCSNVDTILEALDLYCETSDELSKLRGRERYVQHEIAARKAVVLERLLAEGRLGKNETERQINIDAAMYGDDELAASLEEQAELEALVRVIETRVDIASRQLHTFLSALQAQLRHAELRQSEERDSLAIQAMAVLSTIEGMRDERDA